MGSTGTTYGEFAPLARQLSLQRKYTTTLPTQKNKNRIRIAGDDKAFDQHLGPHPKPVTSHLKPQTLTQVLKRLLIRTPGDGNFIKLLQQVRGSAGSGLSLGLSLGMCLGLSLGLRLWCLESGVER